MSSHKDQAGTCPVTTVLDLATTTAKSTLGTSASNKRVSATAALSTSVTENGKVNTSNVDATVTLGVSSSESDAPAGCCEGCPCSTNCACKKTS